MYIDYWNVSKIVGDHWVQFFTEDHWNNVVSSNKFTLTIIPTSPAPAFNNLASIFKRILSYKYYAILKYLIFTRNIFLKEIITE